MVLDDPNLVKREKTAQDKESDWARLEALLDRLSGRRGAAPLSDPELLELGRLYRRAAAELSHARRYSLDQGVIERLNHLVGRAYGEIYRAPSTGWGGIRHFLGVEIPATFRRHFRVFALATGVFLIAAFISGGLVLARPDLLDVLAPRQADLIDQLTQRHSGGDWLPSEVRPLAASAIMVNNIQVSFLAFTLGILLGVGTIYVLVSNGIMLGAIGAGLSRTSASADFWAFVAPHGVLELPAIFISATAGLLLGWALVDPGEYTRGVALRLAGREAVKLVLVVILMLVVAGLVEGFVSPAQLPHEIKFAVAGALAFAFWWYLLFKPLPAGAASRPTTAPAP
jgi:uncharacterized membrane protein SpoIIM required for sporulation